MKKRAISIGLACLCAVSVFCTGSAAKAEVIHETDLEEYIMQEMSDARILGMGAVVVNEENELYCASYGMAERTDYDYVIGDLSQSFTAAGIMHLVEEGEVSLEDNVSDFLPEYTKAADVTVRELLTQTSGITGEENLSDISVSGKGGTFEYAYANYGLLGKIVEAVTGMTYEEYISDNILDPLKMTSTYSLRDSLLTEKDLIPAYRNYFGFPFLYQYQYEENDWMPVSSKHLISDVKDLGKYLQMYLSGGGEVLSNESIDELLHGDVPVSESKYLPGDLFEGRASYAMGWMEKEVGGQDVLYHMGAVENYTSAMILLPEKDLGIALLFNSADAIAGSGLIRKLTEGIVAIELEQDPVDIDPDSYIQAHVIADGLMLLAVFGSWMPIFLLGFWRRRRRNHIGSIPGILIDVLLHLVLPSAVLLAAPAIVYPAALNRFVPDVYYVGIFAIASLYLGGAVKLIMMIVYAIAGPNEKLEMKWKQMEQEKENSDDQEEGETTGKIKKEKKKRKKKEKEIAESPEQGILAERLQKKEPEALRELSVKTIEPEEKEKKENRTAESGKQSSEQKEEKKPQKSKPGKKGEPGGKPNPQKGEPVKKATPEKGKNVAEGKGEPEKRKKKPEGEKKPGESPEPERGKKIPEKKGEPGGKPNPKKGEPVKKATPEKGKKVAEGKGEPEKRKKKPEGEKKPGESPEPERGKKIPEKKGEPGGKPNPQKGKTVKKATPKKAKNALEGKGEPAKKAGTEAGRNVPTKKAAPGKKSGLETGKKAPVKKGEPGRKANPEKGKKAPAERAKPAEGTRPEKAVRVKQDEEESY